MSFLRQIKTEFKNIFRVKFLLIFGIIVLAISAVVPVVTALSANDENSGYFPGGPIIYEKSVSADMYYPGGEESEPITVDGVTITYDNPFYWNIKSIMDEQGFIDSNTFTLPAAYDLVLKLMDEEIGYYVRFAKNITTYEDYRMDLAWNGTQTLYDKFVFENIETEDPAALKEAAQYRMYLEPAAYDKKYVDITAEERLAALDKAETYLESLYSVVENNDFPAYVALRIEQENNNIANIEAQIATQEQTIIENPDQEESLNEYIAQMKKEIELIKTNNIPVLEYRLEKNIIPYSDMWQNTALNDISNSRNELTYTTILTEEKFNQDQYLAVQYGSYPRYVAAMQANIDKLNNKILIAQKSLDADKPDMKYVPAGARSMTVEFLSFSIVVALFAILVGGWIMASEFQMGTIRLLMIRPKTRTKILMSKFLAALLACLALYLAGIIINIIVNGICFGFADFGFPNFTVAGEVAFIGYYIPQFLACIISIIFAYCVAFMLSVVVKNIAISIAVPAVCFVGCVLAMTFLAYSTSMDWVAYTPIPYVQISAFFSQYSSVNTMIQNGVPISLTYGIIMLLVLSAVCTAVSVWVFKKKDITN